MKKKRNDHKSNVKFYQDFTIFGSNVEKTEYLLKFEIAVQ